MTLSNIPPRRSRINLTAFRQDRARRAREEAAMVAEVAVPEAVQEEVAVVAVVAYNDLPTVGTCFGTRDLAIADGTARNDRIGMNFYNAVAEEYSEGPFKRFENLNAVDICNENVKKILGDHARRCRQGWIPKGWHKEGGFQKENTQRLAEDSIINYTKPLLQLLRNLCPEHEYLKGDADKQEWWKKLRQDLRQGYKKIKISGEHEAFDPKCSALYIINKRELVRYSHNDMHILNQIDLHYILKNLKKNATVGNQNHLKIARLSFAAHAACRMGELKFVRISNMVYDPKYRILDTSWCEPKTCNAYAMPMVNHSQPGAYVVDFYHAVGSAFLLVSEILLRRDSDLPDFLFAELHAKKDSNVATAHTNFIRDNLPPGLHPDIVNRYMSKSMRKGDCTHMCHNRELKHENALARSGHSYGANHFGTYVESVGIGLSLPAAMCLNDYEDVYAMPSPCSFDSLPPEDRAHAMIVVEQFFPTNIDAFKTNGRLFPALTIMAATLIMSYNEMRSQYSRTDLVVGKMESIFERTNALSIPILAVRSKTIKHDFIKKNSVTKRIDRLDAAQLQDSINHNTSAKQLMSCLQLTLWQLHGFQIAIVQ